MPPDPLQLWVAKYSLLPTLSTRILELGKVFPGTKPLTRVEKNGTLIYTNFMITFELTYSLHNET